MADAPGREGALAGRLPAGRRGNPAGAEPGLRFSVVTPAAMVLVSGVRAAAVTGRRSASDGPVAVERRLSRQPVRFLWTAPGQWLAVSSRLAPERLQRLLGTALPGRTPVLTDLGHARTVIRIEGPAVFDLLAKGCAVDLEAHGPGASVPTLLAELRVLVHVTGPAVEVYVPRSLAAALWDWLEASAGEFGFTVAGTGDRSA